ncbi:tyrosine-type recombinase/integrase [Microbacterium paludicola]|uniref:tyrosine-type recombinase/integrase n=1 Tax=Microbacterium paludicola TaxID=300019 RepID=UPI00119E0402|nr:tyrosine-type recombinase/integrase [Microbacterium paludicola]
MFKATVPTRDAESARRGFLARYSAGTRDLYELDLRIYFQWCTAEQLDPLDVRRADLEAFVEWLMTVRGNGARSACRRFQTVRSYLRLAVADELIDRDPTHMVRLPKWTADREKIAWLTPIQVARLQQVAADTSPAHRALVDLMVVLGLRVSEACGVQLDDLTEDPSGYTLLSVRRKGGKITTEAIPVPLLRVLDAARDGRTTGPLILTRAGNQQTRNGAYDWIKRLCRKVGLPAEIHPHSLRHTAVTTLVDAGLPMHEVQAFARHADIRSTEWYYRRRGTPDQHASHIAARMYAAVA